VRVFLCLRLCICLRICVCECSCACILTRYDQSRCVCVCVCVLCINATCVCELERLQSYLLLLPEAAGHTAVCLAHAEEHVRFLCALQPQRRVLCAPFFLPDARSLTRALLWVSSSQVHRHPLFLLRRPSRPAQPGRGKGKQRHVCVSPRGRWCRMCS